MIRACQLADRMGLLKGTRVSRVQMEAISVLMRQETLDRREKQDEIIQAIYRAALFTKGISVDDEGNIIEPEADEDSFYDPEASLDFSGVEYESPDEEEQDMLEAMLMQDSITVGTEGE